MLKTLPSNHNVQAGAIGEHSRNNVFSLHAQIKEAAAAPAMETVANGGAGQSIMPHTRPFLHDLHAGYGLMDARQIEFTPQCTRRKHS